MSEAAEEQYVCMAAAQTQSEHDAILKTLQMYIDGCKEGRSEVMRPAFHAQASFFGHAGGQLAVGPEFLFDWIDRNGPVPDIESRVVSVDVAESIWNGRIAQVPTHADDYGHRKLKQSKRAPRGPAR